MLAKTGLPISVHNLDTLKYLVSSAEQQSEANKLICEVLENYGNIMENEIPHIPHPVSGVLDLSSKTYVPCFRIVE